MPEGCILASMPFRMLASIQWGVPLRHREARGISKYLDEDPIMSSIAPAIKNAGRAGTSARHAQIKASTS